VGRDVSGPLPPRILLRIAYDHEPVGEWAIKKRPPEFLVKWTSFAVVF
jgi:hypothetical protein